MQMKIQILSWKLTKQKKLGPKMSESEMKKESKQKMMKLKEDEIEV